jgi:hypothetical protein
VTSTRSTRTGARATTSASAEAALQFAEELARACAGALGETVAGVILHGSLTLDDYLPGCSDVDLLVVIDDSLSDARLGRPAAGHPPGRRLADPGAAAGGLPAPHPRLRGPGGGTPAPLAMELSVCRGHGRSLLGAAPAELLGEVPDRWVVAAGDAQLAAWQAIGDDPPYAELTVLTACRVGRFAEERRHSSKTAAAEWALGRDPTLGVVSEALRRRHGDRAARIDPAQVARLLAVVRARLAEARDHA